MGKYDSDIPGSQSKQGCYENILLAGDNDQASKMPFLCFLVLGRGVWCGLGK
jgi:hypothetical protein